MINSGHNHIKQNQNVMVDFLRPYQNRWIEDQSRFKVWLKCRQAGGSLAVILEIIMECISRSHHNVYVASIAFREAKVLIRRAKKWLNTILPSITGKASPVKTATKTAIKFHNESRIEALPADKIRSRTGTIVLDELAFIPKASEDVWPAIAPAAESNKNLRVICLSTPLGRSGLFYDMVTQADPDHDATGPFENFSLHKLDVWKAAEEGFPVDPLDLQQRYQESTFKREFEAKFISEEDQFFPFRLLVDSQVESLPSKDEITKSTAGVDIGTTNDATVITPCHEADETTYVADPEVIKEPGTYKKVIDQQPDIESHLESYPYDFTGIDAGAQGSDVARTIAEEKPNVKLYWGSFFAQATRVTKDNRIPLVTDIKQKLESGEMKLQASKTLVNAFASIEKKQHSDHSYKFVSNDEEGHSDAFFAALMGIDLLDTNEITEKIDQAFREADEEEERRRVDDMFREDHNDFDLPGL